MWPEKTIDSFSGFVNEIRALNAHWPNRHQWLFRGQTNHEWSLEPSLLRLLDKPRTVDNAQLIAIEKDMRRAFWNEAHRFVLPHSLPEFESDLTGWWALMRHYGAPTRILDWTLSPYVGLYFAVKAHWTQPAAVWCARGKAIGKAFAARYPSTYKKTWKDDRKKAKRNPFAVPDPEPVLYVYEMSHQIDRTSVQQGRFTVCCDALQDHAQTLESHVTPDHLWKFIIPAELKPEFMRELHLMNITAKSLFPGIDGLGRSMEEMARLSIRFDR